MSSTESTTSETDNTPVDVVPGWDGDTYRVFLMLDQWAPNGRSVQSVGLTADQVRALAAELLLAADG
jgi:hypothetical protein